MPRAETPAKKYVRFETMRGVGLYEALRDVKCAINDRRLHLRPRDRREFDGLYHWLMRHTPAPPSRAYRDRRSRCPRTWFKTSAGELIDCALRLCKLLNRYRANLRAVHSDRPGAIIYEDDLQVVVRAPRRPAVPPRHEQLALRRPRGERWSGCRGTIRRPDDRRPGPYANGR